MTSDTLAKLKTIENQIAATIKENTGAVVEVTIREQVMVYTENITLSGAIKNLMSQAKTFIKEIIYEADEDGPGAVTLFFSL